MKRKLVLLRAIVEQITYKKTVLLLIALSVAVSLLNIGFISLINTFIDLQLESFSKGLSSDFSVKMAVVAVVSSLVISPVIETSIFQHLIFHFFKVVRRKGIPIKYIIIGSLLFGLAHQTVWTSGIFLGIVFFIHKVAIGIILATSYYIFYRKRKHALLSTALIHSVHNLFALVFIISDFL
ncbi:MAG TPA: CPBP family glutamic-type intramembrane protease [Salinivirgaceae bacterium]|nr:CPBP family glutamic-type intramembrane protease [Salinivirgaceae bacterium]HQA76634.1 CPBP family glutamic-type intramembrane protease [Salinivirgaceae bacterium]